MGLSPEDYELIERAKKIADDLHVDDLHEVASALRTVSGDIFGESISRQGLASQMFVVKSLPSAT
jgi:hypothetical protein